MSNRYLRASVFAGLTLGLFLAACGDKADRPPATTLPPPTSSTESAMEPTRPEPAPTPPPRAPVDDGEDLVRRDDPLGIREMDLDAVNELKPLADVRFDFDSASLSAQARSTLDEHARILEQYPSMSVLIEGHCDERGTVEYNLALGERRANAVYNYLMSLGIAADRMRTITYGKEFPLDPGHNEEAWAKNRRARFEITSK